MRFACVTIYVNKGGNKKLYKLYTKPYTNPTSRWFSVRCEMYSLRRKLYTNYTQTLHSNYTQSPTKRRSKPYTASVQTPTQRAFAKLYTRRNTNPSFCFWTRMERMERIVRNVCNERDERNKRNERKTGNGNRRWHASSLLQVTKKNPTILSVFSAIWH